VEVLYTRKKEITMPEQAKKPVTHHVTLTFDREVTDEEVKQMQMQHKAISALLATGGGHHDHDHPKLV
jgi:hypothetical protein